MDFDETTKKVKSDSRLGKIRIYKEEEARIFKWIDLKTGNIEFEYYAFPKQNVFGKVKQNKGRVYLLRSVDSPEVRFFWLQVKIEILGRKNKNFGFRNPMNRKMKNFAKKLTKLLMKIFQCKKMFQWRKIKQMYKCQK